MSYLRILLAFASATYRCLPSGVPTRPLGWLSVESSITNCLPPGERCLTIHVETPKLVVHVCGSYQITLGIEVHPIRATALISEQRYLSRFAVPTVNPIVGLVCEVDVTPCVGRRSFRKVVRISESYRYFTFCNDLISPEVGLLLIAMVKK